MLERLAGELGIQGRVRFVGNQLFVADWLVGFDAFVLPSSSGESFGNAAVEAMALGIPTIVCSDGGGLCEHIKHGETGWIVDGITGITECLATQLQDRARAQQIGLAGRASVRERYTLQRMLVAYSELYKYAGIV